MTPPSPHDQPETVVYVECPRDSWQGLRHQIPTAVPQLADTEAVLAELPDPEGRDYLCIVANARGLERAATQPRVTSVGYPLSVSDAFQRRNTGRSLRDSWPLLAELRDLAGGAGKRLVVYLSMGFGNPDDEPWTPETTLSAVERLRDLGVHDVALADTVGRATPELVAQVTRAAVARFGAEGLGVHLHARPEQAVALARAAHDGGIRWFEGALGGVGGCPFAGDALVGNLPTELVAPALGLPYRDLPLLAERARNVQRVHA